MKLIAAVQNSTHKRPQARSGEAIEVFRRGGVMIKKFVPHQKLVRIVRVWSKGLLWTL